METANKTKYQFNINSSQDAEAIIQQWLSANNFQPAEDRGVHYYRAGNAMLGYQGFEYSISGNDVVILAYMRSPHNPMPIEGVRGIVSKVGYRATIQPLLDQLKALSNSNLPVSPQVAPSPTVTPPSAVPVANVDFRDQGTKRSNVFAVVSFALSLIFLILPFLGVGIGLILVLVNYIFAGLGLKSQHRGLAIAAIIITSIDFILTVAMTFLAYQ